jgi:transposase
MANPSESKSRRLRSAGLLHPDPGKVRDPLFADYPEFFDARDLLQVRYELLRAHRVGGERIVEVCHRYGFSRQTFYTLFSKLEEGGTAGLLPDRPGPKGPSKLTPEVLNFARDEASRDPQVTGMVLRQRIETRFGVSIHKRTAERLLRQVRSKKNP